MNHKLCVLLLVTCILGGGCVPTYRAVQSVNYAQVTLIEGITTPNDVISAIGEPDRKNENWNRQGQLVTAISYKTLFTWRSIRIKICNNSGQCIDKDTLNNQHGTIVFVFTDGRYTGGSEIGF